MLGDEGGAHDVDLEAPRERRPVQRPPALLGLLRPVVEQPGGDDDLVERPDTYRRCGDARFVGQVKSGTREPIDPTPARLEPGRQRAADPTRRANDRGFVHEPPIRSPTRAPSKKPPTLLRYSAVSMSEASK